MSKIKELGAWFDSRMPMIQVEWKKHMAEYYAPKNFNFWYFFGVLSLLMLVNQLLTGIWLTMHYTPSAEAAFASVEYIMRDVPYGDLLRYMHSTGASLFFVVIYLHMFRGLMYGSYKAPRELIWVFGMAIYLALMAEAFLGYVLPWGQMSYWGAQVIVSLFGAIPYVGEDIVQWIRGDFLISGATLNRFFALHVVALPIVLLALVVMHILALHEVGSNNPDGVEIKKYKDENGKPLDGIAFFPYYLPVHDSVAVVIFLFVFAFIMFFLPEMGGYFLEHANFEEANGLKTPDHIAPVWYFTPYYSMLRAVPDKLMGFVAMGSGVVILFVLPWLDKSPVKSIRYRGTFSRVAIVIFIAAFIILGILGVKAPTDSRTLLAQICTVIYFGYFIGMPFWTKREAVKQEPDRITMDGGMGGMKTLGVGIIIALLIFLPLKAVGAEGKACGTIDCDPIAIDLKDKASLQTGAKLFANYCMGCHAVAYSRWERVADDLEMPHALVEENLIFGDQKKGDLMKISMSKKLGKQFFGTPPPDLSLAARARSPEWLYTYLRNFYQDDSRPFGVNNRVFKDVGMPHVLLELQGVQNCAPGPVVGAHGGIKEDPLTGEALLDDPCGSYTVAEEGTLSAEEFDTAMYDLVNFMTYVAEPGAERRKEIGVYVLLFLAFLFVFVWLLNREYWKEIH